MLPTGNLIFPIRHAGQYYDQETNLFYNYFRDYDPVTGRYVQSDPIGLNGGLNTYGYVGGSPLLNSDSLGLFVDTTGAFTKGASAVIQQGARVGIMCAAPAVAVGVGLLGVSTSAGSCETAPIECPNDKCEEIRKNINYWLSELKRRYHDLKMDKSGLYRRQPNGPHSYAGHRARFSADQKNLEFCVNKAKAIPCIYNIEADSWLKKSAPTRPTPR